MSSKDDGSGGCCAIILSAGFFFLLVVASDLNRRIERIERALNIIPVASSAVISTQVENN